MKNLPYLTHALIGAALLAGCTVAPVASRTTPKHRAAPAPAAAPVAKQEPAPVTPRVVSAAEIEPIAARCPLAIPGVSISAENSHMGAALVFIGVGDPDPLRGEVTAMADAHNRMHAAMGPLPGEEPRETVTVTVPRPEDEGPVPVPPESGTEQGDQDEDSLMDPYKDDQDPTLASGGATARAEGAEAPSMTDEDLTIVKTHSRARADTTVDKGARLVFIADEDDVEDLRNEVRTAAADLRESCGIAPVEEID